MSNLRDSVPAFVDFTITLQLRKLRQLCSSLEQGRNLDEMFGGEGRYEAEVFDKLFVQDVLKEVDMKLAELRAAAPEDYDFDALLAEYDFPVIALTKAGEEYLLALQVN